MTPPSDRRRRPGKADGQPRREDGRKRPSAHPHRRSTVGGIAHRRTGRRDRVDERSSATQGSRGFVVTNRDQGRALGIVISAFLQDPRKEVLPQRGLFTQAIALRLRSRDEVTMVLGEGLIDAAPAHRISPDRPGTGVAVVVEIVVSQTRSRSAPRRQLSPPGNSRCAGVLQSRQDRALHRWPPGSQSRSARPPAR